MIFLVHARTGTVDGAGPTASGTALAQRLSADPRLREVTSYWTTKATTLRSKDGTDALILTSVVGDEKQADSNATALLKTYGHIDDANVTVQIGGQRGADIGGQVGKDLALAESIAVPITIVLLIIAFGSLVASFLPLSVGVVAIVGTLAELRVLTEFTSVSIFAINLTTALGLGLGIDYALLMVSRFREELASGIDVSEAVARTTASAGRTIAFSALTVAAALAALLVFPVYFLKSFAYAGVAVTIFAAVERAAGSAGAARDSRAEGECRTGARDQGRAQYRSAVLGPARDRGHAPPSGGRVAGDRRAALPGDSAARGFLQHPRRSGAADECPQPSGRRRVAQRLCDCADRDRCCGHLADLLAGPELITPAPSARFRGYSAPTAQPAVSPMASPVRRRRMRQPSA